MEFKWTPDVLNEGQTVNSATFEAENRVFKLSLTKSNHTYMSIEYIGISYTDVITKMKFDINGTEKEITYTFNRYDVIFTFPIEPATSYTILASFSIHPIPYSSKKETGYTGLRNLGATCYMNALIQCLYHIKKFRAEVFLQEPKRKTFQLQKLLYKLTNDFDVDTRSFMNNCRWVDNVFTQQDIHEFTINVFHALENENKTIDDEEKIDHGKIDDNFFVDRLFKGMMNNYIKGDCGCLSVTKSTFYDLSFEIRDWCNNQVAKNINESLEQLDAEEVLENDNQYHCEKHGKVNARKGIEIAKLPPVLLVLLKRFSMNYETFESSKVNDYYEFFDSINFTLNRKTNAESQEEKETIASDSELLTPLVEQGMHPCLTEPESAKYDLFGVIVHSGGTSDGHYYCYIKLDGWYKFNDTVVTRVCEEEALYDNFGGINPYKNFVKNHSAYMLIYVDSTKWNEIIETKVDLLQSLIDRIKESESGKSMDIRYVTRNDILGYNGIGLFYFEDDVTLRDKIQTMKARSDDTLYVFEKNARKKYVNIYDAITFEKLSSDDSVDDKRIYFVCETSYKVNKKSVLVFVKKYRNNDECLKNNFIDFELKACIYIDKNEKGLEAITSAMNIEDNYCIYVEERLNVKEDLNDTTQETEPEIDPTPIDTSSTKKERKILKKEISQYIEEKEQPTKKRNASKNKTCKYSLKKYDPERTYKENGISNGSIFICVKKTEEQQLIDDYNGVKNRRHIVLKTDNFTTVKYINQDLNYPGLLKFVSDCFMCDNIEIVKFKGTIGSNNMEELKIKHDPKYTAIRICNGTGVQDLNKIKHIHELLVESKVVRGLYRKISVLECFKKDISIEKSKEEFYAKEGIKEEIHAEITYNKKVYDTLKENFTLLEVYKNSSVIYEYESVDEYKGDGLLVVKEKTEEKELRMVRSNGTNFIGYPIILPLKDLRTVKEFRLHYGILSRLTRYSSGAEHTLEEDDKVDNFDNLDVMVNYES